MCAAARTISRYSARFSESNATREPRVTPRASNAVAKRRERSSSSAYVREPEPAEADALSTAIRVAPSRACEVTNDATELAAADATVGGCSNRERTNKDI